MGDPIDEYEEGQQCTICWGPGKTFGDYPTPKHVYLTGSGFVGACAVCNGKFIATQSPVAPCGYTFDDGSAKGALTYGVAVTTFQMGISGGAWCLNQAAGLCAKSITVGAMKVEVS
jgi:hypothetical protein